jgi:hypothetical protein
MDDSDEYVFDDIILDEQTLANLDQQERQFLGESSYATSTSASEPVNKKLKTNNGWTPGPANIDYDEMPEICLQRDGTYALGNPVNALTVSMCLPLYANNRGNSKTTSIRRTEPTVNIVGASTTNPQQLPDQVLELQKKLDEVGIQTHFVCLSRP